MAKQKCCRFCDEERIKNYLKDGKDGTRCNACIYEDRYCFAILSDEAYTIGHTLVIPKDHKIDITDRDLSKASLSRFIHAIHKVAVQLKKSAQDKYGNHPERIYVSMLGDGIKHLHAHLIPRYPFTKNDKTTYGRLFTPRNGKRKVKEAIDKGELGGFWYIAEREKSFVFAKKSSAEKAACLSKLAKNLRFKRPCNNQSPESDTI